MKLIIAGGRDATEEGVYDAMYHSLLDKFKPRLEMSEIVCGGARGADSWGEKWAKETGIPIKFFIPDWDGLGKRAGYARNSDMADYADGLIAVWDGKSKGTKHMIDLATKKGLEVYVFNY